MKGLKGREGGWLVLRNYDWLFMLVRNGCVVFWTALCFLFVLHICLFFNVFVALLDVATAVATAVVIAIGVVVCCWCG